MKILIKFLLISLLLAGVNSLSAMERMKNIASVAVTKISNAASASKSNLTRFASAAKNSTKSIISTMAEKAGNSASATGGYLLGLTDDFKDFALTAKEDLSDKLSYLNEEKLEMARSLLSGIKSCFCFGYNILTNKKLIVMTLLAAVAYLSVVHPIWLCGVLGSLAAVRILVVNISAFLISFKKQMYEKLAIPSALFLACMVVFSAAKIKGII